MRTIALAVLMLALTSLAACGPAEIGEECESTGSTDECVEGAICDTEDDAAVCLELCEEDVDCGSGYQCTGVSGGNRKACHEKKK